MCQIKAGELTPVDVEMEFVNEVFNLRISANYEIKGDILVLQLHEIKAGLASLSGEARLPSGELKCFDNLADSVATLSDEIGLGTHKLKNKYETYLSIVINALGYAYRNELFELRDFQTQRGDIEVDKFNAEHVNLQLSDIPKYVMNMILGLRSLIKTDEFSARLKSGEKEFANVVVMLGVMLRLVCRKFSDGVKRCDNEPIALRYFFMHEIEDVNKALRTVEGGPESVGGTCPRYRSVNNKVKPSDIKELSDLVGDLIGLIKGKEGKKSYEDGMTPDMREMLKKLTKR